MKSFLSFFKFFSIYTIRNRQKCQLGFLYRIAFMTGSFFGSPYAKLLINT